MCYFGYTHWLTSSCLALAICVGVLPAQSQAAQASAFSRWLSGEAIPELREVLTQHPRYTGQRVQVSGHTGDALSEAIAIVVSSNLAGRGGIALVAKKQATSIPRVVAGSIDELECNSAPRFDYLLQVSTVHSPAGQDRVQLELRDSGDAGEPSHSWQWLGEFSAPERRHLKKTTEPPVADGSLGAPWSDIDVGVAASSLSRDFACALRPQIKTRLALQWPKQDALPALFADTVSTSRHLLGSYRELGISAVEPDYRVAIRLQRFRQDTWQLWLTGTPLKNDLAPVQAVTYFVAVDPGVPMLVARAITPRAIPPADPGIALEFIDVQLLDATQTDEGNSRAELQVTLRIGNRATWPIQYSFTLSGGHFNHCVASPGYYRHDRYGHLAGSVEPGDSVVRRLVIKDAQHRPRPWFGSRKCAGFRDLEGFEKFASQGYKVTDFVRWDM
jgi:hypothetical protein